MAKILAEDPTVTTPTADKSGREHPVVHGQARTQISAARIRLVALLAIGETSRVFGSAIVETAFS